jgi:hypothetical protein
LNIAANVVRVYGKKKNPTVEKWTRPIPRHIKLNVDAAYYEKTKSRAPGAILRDSHGSFVVASVKYIPYVLSAAMAEAYAIKESLFPTEVVHACLGEDAWLNESSAFYAYCIDLVASIGSVSLSYY